MQKPRIYSQCLGNMQAWYVSLVAENSPPATRFQNSIENKNREVLSKYRWIQRPTRKKESEK